MLWIGLLSSPVLAQDKDNVPSVLEGNAIVRRNGVFYNNRPLYGGHGRPAFPYYWVFSSDRPFLRFGGDPWVDGCFVPGFQKAGGATKWLLDFKTIESRYYGGRVEWVVSDPEFPGVTISLHALPLGEGTGLAAQARVTGAGPGDQLVWMLGSAYHNPYVKNIDAMAADSRNVRYDGFNPAQAEGNLVEIKDGVIRLEPPHYPNSKYRYSLAACSAVSKLCVADADQWKTPAALLASTGSKRPVVCGLSPIVSTQPITWIVRAWESTETGAAAPNVAADFRTAWERVETLNRRVVSKTPDPRFDFIVGAATSALDGIWRTTAYGDSGSSAFPHPLLGFRKSDGGTSYGWHDRVRTEARTWIASQVTGETYKNHPELSPMIDKNEELSRYVGTFCHPGPDPRFHSKGRLIPNENSTMYDMQSQFFDQMIEDWRFTADPEMEKLLRPALELHLGYIERCFDPDGDGTYESFSNTFLTDTVWYNGGGTPDETAFAYRGHQAARDMAKRAGDTETVKRHEAKLALIRRGFFEKLWVDQAGHPGAYREQGGLQRLHADAWLPGLYLPMDCPGLFNDEQMASTLHFTEYALQHEQRPLGGVRLYPSNWVPSVWSNREKSPGDEYALALGYCFAGLPEGALEIIRGNIHEAAFESAVPGSLGVPYASCGIDWGDAIGSFARTVVSGIFGYRPDRPNGLVTVAPQFPAAWDHASFKHPEFALEYQRQGGTEHLSIELERESAMELQLPFRSTAVKSATLNGQPVQGTIQPGFGRSIYVVRTPVIRKAELVLELERELPLGVAQVREVDCGSDVELAVEGGPIKELRDAQGVLESPQILHGKVKARVGHNLGNHRLLALVQMGQAPQWRIFDFLVRDRAAEQYAAEKNLRQAPSNATWTGIDLSSYLNGRVTDIFRQEYLSPRPDTQSLRLAKDAYGVWNGVYAGKLPPAIDLSNTRPRRPVPVYDAAISNLTLDKEMTLETWLWADLSDMAPWTSAQILESGDFSMDLLYHAGRLLRMYAPQPIYVGSSIVCGERMTHLAVVFRSGQPGQIFYDGKKTFVETAPFNLTTMKLGPTLRLGANRRGGNRLLGRIERVAISTHAATAEELKNRSLDAAPLAGTVADWRIPEAGAPEVASSVPGGPALVRQEIAFQTPKTLPEPLNVVNGMLQVPQGARFKWNPGAKDIAFTSLWDNWPRKVDVQVNQKGDSVWLLVAGSTNPMQVRIANAVLRFQYADGVTEQLELVNPMNFWSLCPFQMQDYNYAIEGFSLPKEPPSQVQLGTNCRAMVYGWKLRKGVKLKQVTLESLSQEVVIGLMGLSVMNEK